MKHVNMTVAVDPRVKQLALAASKADRRTLSALIEILVLEHAPRLIEARRGLQLAQQSS
jgi:hypothetical protein